MDNLKTEDDIYFRFPENHSVVSFICMVYTFSTTTYFQSYHICHSITFMGLHDLTINLAPNVCVAS